VGQRALGLVLLLLLGGATQAFAAPVVLTTIRVGTSPQGVAVNAATGRAYVTNTGDNTVSVIDTTANKALTTIRVASPIGVAVNATTGWAYVTNFSANTVSVIEDALPATRR